MSIGVLPLYQSRARPPSQELERRAANRSIAVARDAFPPSRQASGISAQVFDRNRESRQTRALRSRKRCKIDGRSVRFILDASRTLCAAEQLRWTNSCLAKRADRRRDVHLAWARPASVRAISEMRSASEAATPKVPMLLEDKSPAPGGVETVRSACQLSRTVLTEGARTVCNKNPVDAFARRTRVQ